MDKTNRREYMKQYYEKHKEMMKEYNRKNYLKRKEKRLNESIDDHILNQLNECKKQKVINMSELRRKRRERTQKQIYFELNNMKHQITK